MRELTIGEKLFIDNNYQTHKPMEMAGILEISGELVRGYMEEKQYKSICRRKAPAPLSNDDKAFIRSNSAGMTINQLCVHLLRGFNLVKRFVEAEKLPFKTSASGRPTTIIKIFHHQPDIKQPFERVKAVYSNPDWQQYGEELLK